MKYYLILLFLSFIFIIILFIQTNVIEFKEYKIKLENKSKCKIIFFSDLHLGSFLKPKELKKIIKKLLDLNGDIYIFGGDIIGKKIAKYYDLDLIQEIFKPLNSKICLCISGNHEYQKDKYLKDDKIKYLKAMGFILLENEFYNYQDIKIFGLKSGLVNGDFKIREKVDLILSHEPDIIDKYENVIMLSGHTHGGQIRIPYFPYYKPILGKKYLKGKYVFDNKTLYISKGLGFGKMRLRFLAKRDILILMVN